MTKLVGMNLNEIPQIFQKHRLFKNFNDTKILIYEEIENKEEYKIIGSSNNILFFADNNTINEWDLL